MSKPDRKSITDEELTKLIERHPAEGAAVGLVLMRLLHVLQEININIQHVAAAIDDMAKSNVHGADIDRLGRSLKK